jgi:hypothetical protein
MKRFMCAAGFLVFGSALIFSQNLWTTANFTLGNTFVSSEAGTRYSISPGYDFTVYGFFWKGKDTGLFFQDTHSHPAVFQPNEKNAGFETHRVTTLGIGRRYTITENIQLQTGLGFACASSNPDGRLDSKNWETGLGLGTDIAIKFNIGKYFYFNTGFKATSVFTLFYNGVFFKDIQGADSLIWTNDVTPYAGIGTNWGFFGKKRG